MTATAIHVAKNSREEWAQKCEQEMVEEHYSSNIIKAFSEKINWQSFSCCHTFIKTTLTKEKGF